MAEAIHVVPRRPPTAAEVLQHKLLRLQADDLKRFVHSFRDSDFLFDHGAMILGSTLLESQPRRLESIKLRTTGRGPCAQGTKDLRDFLATSSSLKEFSLAGRKVPHASLYLQALQQNMHLQKLAIMCTNLPIKAITKLIRTTPTLRHLEVCGNRIKISARTFCLGQHEMNGLLEALSTNMSLECLELYLLDVADYRTVSQTTNYNPATIKAKPSRSRVKHLRLDDNKLSPAVLTDLWNTFPCLQTLRLNGNDASHDGLLGSLLDGHRPVSTLQSFQLSSSYFEPTQNGIWNPAPFQDVLVKNPDLVELAIGNQERTSLENEFFTQIGRGLADRSRMNSMAFTSPLTNTNLHCLLQPFTTRQTPLVISDLSLEFKNETTLPSALGSLLTDPSSSMCSIRKLTLDFGELTNAICHELWMCLRRNTSLESLVVKGHGADEDLQSRAAFGSLAEGLPQLNLKELTLDEGLRESLLGLKCLIAFPLDDAAAPLTTTTLTKLTLSHMVLGDAMIGYCAKVMAHPRCFLRHLSFCHCRMNTAGVQALLEPLTSSTSVLKNLEVVKDGGFSPDEATTIAALLPKIVSLKELTLHGFHRLDFRHVADLKPLYLNAMSKNKSLQKLDLDLEVDGFVFHSILRFYGLRNKVDEWLAHEGGDDTGAEAGPAIGTIPTKWISLLESLLNEDAGCFSAAFHLLSRKVDILIPS